MTGGFRLQVATNSRECKLVISQAMKTTGTPEAFIGTPC
jgi:hypothetical protein